MRIAVAMVSGCGIGAPWTMGSEPCGLEAPHHRGLGREAGVGVLAVAQPVGRDVARVADRQDVHVGRLAERVDDLERCGLLTLQAHRVDRVDQRDGVLVGQGARQLQALVEAAAHLDDLGAVHDGLRHLAGGDLAVRDEHDRGESALGRVGGHGGRGVAGRGAHDGLRALAERDRHRGGHAAVLERAGRVAALDLEEHVTADDARQPGRVHERRAALPQRDDGSLRGDREPLAVLLDDASPQMCHQNPPSTRITDDTSRTMSSPRSEATVADSAASSASWVTMTS